VNTFFLIIAKVAAGVVGFFVLMMVIVMGGAWMQNATATPPPPVVVAPAYDLVLKTPAELAADKKDTERRQKADARQRRREGVVIGMSQKDVIASSWGKPRKINTTTRASGVREQWVYGGGYLYFQDGVLTSIQN